MNGAEVLIQTALNAGIEVCFANPGTTELPLVAALDSIPGMRAILCLFEGVCTGAADGYGRMRGRPAVTLLHHGPGLANGIANLHNARRARSPIVNLIGDHLTWHKNADAPLNSDVASLARSVSGFVRVSGDARHVSSDVAEAISAASRFPGSIASLILPEDCQSGEAGTPAPILTEVPAPIPSERAVSQAAVAIRQGKAALLLGGPALLHPGLRQAARIVAATGCTLFCDTFPARCERGVGTPRVEKLPYFPEQVLKRLSDYRSLILAGTSEPVAFFGKPGLPSRLIPEGCTPVELSNPEENSVEALAMLADMLHAPRHGPQTELIRPPRPTGELSPTTLGLAIASMQPEGTIVMDEAATSGLPHFLASTGLPPFTYLTLTGGAIGQGLPCATGAAIACPDQKVVAFQADGSGMFTLQSLWTQARENLDVTTVICANRSYRIIQLEMSRASHREPGPQARALTELTRPVIDWVYLAQGMGVPAVRVDTADEAVNQLERAFSERGPHLIEAVL
jgi:acetolactate synthase-1/2/3 large subunit